MKKTTTAAVKKAAKKAVKKAAVKTVAPAPVKKVAPKAPAKKVATPKVVEKKVAPKKVAAPKAAAPQKAAPKKAAPPKAAAKKSSKKAAPKTTIVANANVGFGNSLFLRGSATGLSWSEGVPMECKSDSSWSIDIAGVTSAFEFKVLINDEYWNAGYNDVAQPGIETVIDPQF